MEVKEKRPFLTEAEAQQMVADVPTPFHVYDEKGIRANARRINEAFSWNKGFREYFAVKALPNPYIMQILREEGCGVDFPGRLTQNEHGPASSVPPGCHISKIPYFRKHHKDLT